jgi:hypothetical protein
LIISFYVLGLELTNGQTNHRDDLIMIKLPPVYLVKTWLDLLQNKNLPKSIRAKRLWLIGNHFGSIENAGLYVDVSEYNHKRVS